MNTYLKIMTPEEINQLFEKQIFIKGIHKNLEIDKNQMANYRRRCNELSLGLKLELLLKLDVIKIQPNEPKRPA
ncbi:hypothetical protein [Flavobacterium phage 2A]|uniref:Uncharacterized protein n=3 Tax=root TaxID=1 RepID=A0A1B0WMN2_9CAUD|nr:hypothetical protein BOX10_gp10 [Flavobacterium phage 2A]YP_009592316.1 hypothetical protein FDG69_gp08 [Flavobacterium phage 23T]ANB40921.1 hypothetical protein [Flavobacterium phage 2A]ANB40980.1 hypothetical protein [Flavobacterium phage 23T]